MEYILVLDPNSKSPSTYVSYSGFVATYGDYEDAKTDGEECKDNNDCQNYGVYVRCTDERNFLV